MSRWQWVPFNNDELIIADSESLWSLEVRIDIFPRPGYCDRGRWECHVIDQGFPTNPNPIDHHDMFPRLFFSLERAKAEMEDWMDARKYTPYDPLEKE